MKHPLWALLFAVIVIVLAIAGAMWWIETRFSPDAVLIVFAALVLGGTFLAGMMISRSTANAQLNAFVQAMATVAPVLKEHAKGENTQLSAMREYTKADVAMFMAMLRHSQLDDGRVHKLADQRAKLLTAEKNDAPAEDPQEAPAWMTRGALPVKNGGGNFFG